MASCSSPVDRGGGDDGRVEPGGVQVAGECDGALCSLLLLYRPSVRRLGGAAVESDDSRQARAVPAQGRQDRSRRLVARGGAGPRDRCTGGSAPAPGVCHARFGRHGEDVPAGLLKAAEHAGSGGVVAGVEWFSTTLRRSRGRARAEEATGWRGGLLLTDRHVCCATGTVPLKTGGP